MRNGIQLIAFTEANIHLIAELYEANRCVSMYARTFHDASTAKGKISSGSITTLVWVSDIGFPLPTADHVQATITAESICMLMWNSLLIQKFERFAVVDRGLIVRKGDILLVGLGG